MDEILAGTQSCVAATSPAGLDLAKLQSDGWRAATMSENGKPVASPLTFYGKGRLLLIIDAKNPKPFCILTAKITSVREYPRIQAYFASAFGAPLKDNGKGEQMFFPPNSHIIVIASTGSADSPSVRVAVGPVAQEKK